MRSYKIDLFISEKVYPQLIIKLEKLFGYQTPIKELRNLCDKIESHLRSLLTLGVDSEHFGTMLISIIVSKLPNEIRLEISRKLGKDNWKIHQCMDNLNGVIRKNYTTQALLTNNGHQPNGCFGKQNHYHDKCPVIT